MKKKAKEAISPETLNMMSIGQRLHQARFRRNLSQKALAEAVGTTVRTIRRWERDQAIPHPCYRDLLCETLRTDAPTLFGTIIESEQTTSSAPSLTWHVPHSRNLYFTGREQILTTLSDMLKTPASSPILALSGLPGIGKTQTAVEFAYRFADSYRAVLWVGAETRDHLHSDLVTLAHVLDLPEKQEQNQEHIIAAVKRWLAEQKDWLLILDNVEDLSVVNEAVGSQRNGTVLLTTRAQATGTVASRVPLNQMEQDEGALFLLRRAKLLAPNAQLEEVSEEMRTHADTLGRLMDGLPLALDQVGAYLEETGRTLPDYITLYQQRQSTLLNLRGGLSTDHPQSVSTTFSLVMERLEQKNPAAVELLRLYAFLYPEDIPEELLSQAASVLDPPLDLLAEDSFALDQALKALRSFSLVQRHPQSKTLSLHRLVQAVVKASLKEEDQHLWVQRCVRTVNQALPSLDNSGTSWLRRQQYLTQAQRCAELVAECQVQSHEVAQLLGKLGQYFCDCYAQYGRAHDYHQQALTIAEQTFGPDHPAVAECISYMGILAYQQQEYTEAEHFYQRALDIQRRTLGEEHLDVADNLNNLALVYYRQGRDAEAEPLYQRALFLVRKEFGSEHSHVAIALGNLAVCYLGQQRYHEAEETILEALDIMRRTGSSDHLTYANQLRIRGAISLKLGKYEEAERLFQEALALFERTAGRESPRLLNTLKTYLTLLEAQQRDAEAQGFRERIARIEASANKT